MYLGTALWTILAASALLNALSATQFVRPVHLTVPGTPTQPALETPEKPRTAVTLVPEHSADPGIELPKRLVAAEEVAEPVLEVDVVAVIVITVVGRTMAVDAITEMETETPVDAIAEMETETPVDVATETRAETAVEITNSHEATLASVLTPIEEILTAAVEELVARVEMAVRVATVAVVAVQARSLRRVLTCVRDFLRACSPPVWRDVQEGVQDQESNNYQNHLIEKLKSNLFLAFSLIFYICSHVFLFVLL